VLAVLCEPAKLPAQHRQLQAGGLVVTAGAPCVTDAAVAKVLAKFSEQVLPEEEENEEEMEQEGGGGGGWATVEVARQAVQELVAREGSVAAAVAGLLQAAVP
jgi:hypothetical protein